MARQRFRRKENHVEAHRARGEPGVAGKEMLRGAGELIDVCKHRIHHDPFHVSADGDFSWEEVECLGACVNAPMVMIWKDTYEDLTTESFGKVLDGFASGNPPKPGPQIDRQFSAPVGGPTTLKTFIKAED